MPYNFPDANINQHFFLTHTFDLKTANYREPLTWLRLKTNISLLPHYFTYKITSTTTVEPTDCSE